MRALVAESNVVTRVTLTRILERAGFGVEELHDELAAVSLLYQPDPPELALLALDTLLVDFGSICAAMREAKPDVFIVALVPDGRRNEVLRALQSGADDFLIKPVTIQEADARVFVMRRTMAARGIIELPPEDAEEPPAPFANAPDEAKDGPGPPDDVDGFPEAHEDLRDASPEPPYTADEALSDEDFDANEDFEDEDFDTEKEPEEDDAAPEEDVPALEEEPKEPTLLDDVIALDVEHAFETVLDELGLGPITTFDPAKTQILPFYTAWAPLIVRTDTEAVWLNLRLDLERPSATRLYHAVTKKATIAEEAILKLLRDIIGLVQDSLQRGLLQRDGVRVYMPVLPTALQTDRFPSMGSLASKAGEQRLHALLLTRDVRVKVAYTAEPIYTVRRTLTSLRRLDILATPIQTKGDHVMLLSDGILLNDAYINKVHGFIHSHNLEREVTAFRPPGGLTIFLFNLFGEES